MYDLITIPTERGNRTYGSDDYGQFGSVFASDDDLEIPTPLNFTPNPTLDQLPIQAGTQQPPITHRLKQQI